MWNRKIEELRSDLNRKLEDGISLSTDVLEISQKLDIAINEFYESLKTEDINELCS